MSFSLAVSEDGNLWFEVYNNLGNGDNGWFNFLFKNEIKTRYVRLNCIRNTSNKYFHIVEFQIFDEETKAISKNSHDIPVFGLFGISSVIQENLKNVNDKIKTLSNKFNDEILAANDLKNSIKSDSEKLQQIINSAKIGANAKEFAELAEENKKDSRPWFFGALIISILIFLYCLYSIYFDDRIFSIVEKYKNYENSFAYLQIGISIFSKALIIAGAIYLLKICVTTFRAYKHNQKINEHKATIFKLILDLREGTSTIKDPVELEKILISSINIIFTHQKTGFSTIDKNDSDILLGQVMDLIKSSKN